VRRERDCLRLDCAARMLLDGASSIATARCAGYSSSRQLAEPLRSRFGVTATRMREIGKALRTVRWEATHEAPYRGSWQQTKRQATWRAARRVLRDAQKELAPGTLPAHRVEKALRMRLPRPREPQAPLSVYQAFGPIWTEGPEARRPRKSHRRAA
jgi:hypothetical protein